MADFTILRRIGGGSYGEVFLARNVTGAYRALKVVRREDFEFAKTFEREFDGIRNYIDVSQGHVGLVDVFHVGRIEDEGFYYYVMDLADDSGGMTADADEPDDDAWWQEYEPRTLSSDLRDSRCRPVRECVSVGKMLLGALGHLHSEGLTHRDVKPSNIIFVKGDARLADIGLVAQRGQRTFVGTEGYLPPEGPGTYAADLYAVAMVLYEMHTGKDRLDFPELPSNMELPRTVNRDEWRALNAVICRAGSPDPAKRYPNAETFAAALGEAIGESPVKQTGPAALFSGIGMLMVSLFILGLAAYLFWGANGEGQSDIPVDESLASVQDSAPEIPIVEKDSRPPDPEDFSTLVKPGSDMVDTLTSSGNEDLTEFFTFPFGGLSKVAPPAEVKKTDESTEMVIGGNEPDEPPIPEVGSVRIPSTPTGASVFVGEKEVGLTNTFIDLEPGKVELRVQLAGYRDHRFQWNIKAGKRELLPRVQMVQDRRPVVGQRWVNSVGIEFEPVGETHISTRPISEALLIEYLKRNRKPLAQVDGRVVIEIEADRWEFCDWLTRGDRTGGFLDEDHYYAPQPLLSPEERGAFAVSIQAEYGTIRISSLPEEAEVYDSSGKRLGVTPYQGEWRAGVNRYEVRKPGYATYIGVERVTPGQFVGAVSRLKRDGSLIFGQRWENSLGVPIVPISENLMAAAWETRLRDFMAFWSDTQSTDEPMPIYFKADWNQVDEEPVVNVNRSQAEEFCKWLTKREKEMNRIGSRMRYRLPTDLEWSIMAGLDTESPNAVPMQRDGQVRNHFPWDSEEWPPPPGIGNFADVTGRSASATDFFPEYNDGFRYSSPVGSFKPNRFGLFDMAGNVMEWVSDPYQPGSEEGTLRGGHYDNYEQRYLETSYRDVRPADDSDVIFGFRVVLAKE